MGFQRVGILGVVLIEGGGGIAKIDTIFGRFLCNPLYFSAKSPPPFYKDRKLFRQNGGGPCVCVGVGGEVTLEASGGEGRGEDRRFAHASFLV